MNEYELAGIETIARGICIVEGKILLCRAKGGDSAYLPGGHIEFGETGRQALVREIREELGVESAATRFRGVVENQFMQHGKPHAEINLIYTLELTSKLANPKAKEDWIEFEWCPLDKLPAVKILPAEFLRLSSEPETDFAP